MKAQSIAIKISPRPRPVALPALRLFCQAALDELCSALGWPAAALSIWICSDATIHRLNRLHRQVDRPTDVLSFPQLDAYNGQLRGEGATGAGKHPDFHLGDIVIAWPYLERQARAYAQHPLAECERLLVHGLVHLAGFDHERSRPEQQIMQKMEQRIRRALKKRLIGLRS